ncbi:MAG: prolyl oligopeptidase family serine peptidase [Vicinamibacterales bacterium]
MARYGVDYKASYGYRRESRLSVYGFIGGVEVESLLGGVEYLVTTQGVDRRQIGIFGHSYGAEITLMALLTKPGVFAAGAAPAAKLQDRLLMIHGIEDTNVPIQDAFRFSQRLIELKKTGWELAVYQVEPHLFRHASSRLDMMRRRLALWEAVLKGPLPAARVE